MKSKNLHIVHTESSGGWGGQEIRILTEAKIFIEHGHQVTLLVSNNSPIAHRAKEKQLTVIELPIGKKNIKGLFALRKWITNNDFDIINTHSSSDSWMTALAMRLTSKRKPLVRTRHVSAPVSNNWSTRWLYQKASDHIVTTGERLRETLIRDNDITAEKITSVPTGIDCNHFTPVSTEQKQQLRKELNLPINKFIIGIVATLRSWKGHRYLIEAFHQLNNPEAHLLIVGNGPQWESINQHIKQLGIEGQVTLCGDQKDVAPWLQSMDIFTLPSYANEGVPQSIMQAMACGLPVISTDVGSINELINHNNGIITKTQDSDRLQTDIETLYNDAKKRSLLGENGRRHTLEHCHTLAMFEKMLSIFNSEIKGTQ